MWKWLVWLMPVQEVISIPLSIMLALLVVRKFEEELKVEAGNMLCSPHEASTWLEPFRRGVMHLKDKEMTISDEVNQ